MITLDHIGFTVADYTRSKAFYEKALAPLGFTLGSPRDSARRGAHVSIRRADARELTRRMIAAGEFVEGDTVVAAVDPRWRHGATQGHSGTHMVHAALRQVLDSHRGGLALERLTSARLVRYRLLIARRPELQVS